MQVVAIDELGGPEKMVVREQADPRPGPGELVVEVEAAGVNFMDLGARAVGLAGWELPFTLGVEGAGRVVERGAGGDGPAIGDRVAWVFVPGSYTDRLVIPEAAVVPVPDGVTSEQAAAVMMQGLAAHHFATVAAPLEAGDVALVHAAAGGVGSVLIQLLVRRGVRVIGLVSRTEKVPAARAAGAEEVLVSSGGDFVEAVLERTDGRGVHAVFDGAGAATFAASIAVTRRHGALLYYGPFIGDVPTLAVIDLPRSMRLSYPSVIDHVPDRASLRRHGGELLELVRAGELRVDIGARYALADAAQAHRDLASRTTSGKLLLIPGDPAPGTG